MKVNQITFSFLVKNRQTVLEEFQSNKILEKPISDSMSKIDSTSLVNNNVKKIISS